jgi:dihydrofolate reductase
MRKLSSFMFITLNGFYKDLHNDTSWHQHDAEGAAYSEEAMQSESILLFGRKTYEMMSGFWPTPMAAELFPKVAAGMNKAEKIVYSNTLTHAYWNNTRVIDGDIVNATRQLKSTAGNDLTILGSGTIITTFTNAGLIDTYQFMIDPLALGNGVSIFNGIQEKLDLKLVDHRAFKSGALLVTYEKR